MYASARANERIPQAALGLSWLNRPLTLTLGARKPKTFRNCRLGVKIIVAQSSQACRRPLPASETTADTMGRKRRPTLKGGDKLARRSERSICSKLDCLLRPRRPNSRAQAASSIRLGNLHESNGAIATA